MINLFKKKHFHPSFNAALMTIMANGLAIGIKFTITLISIPLIIGYLGASMYGLITTVLTMCIWINTIADGGVGLSLKNAIIKQHAEKNSSEKISELISSAFFATLALSILLCLALSCIIPWLDWNKILNIQISISHSDLTSLILILLWTTLLIIPFSLPKLIYSAFQQEYLFSPWLILGSILGIGLQIFIIKENQGFILAASALQIGSWAGALFGTTWFIQSRKNLSFTFFNVKWQVLRGLAGSSMDFLLFQLTALAIFQSGIVITNSLLGQEKAAIYAIHFQLFAYLQMLTTLIIAPFWSILAQAYYQNNKLLFKKILGYLTLFIFLLTLLISGMLAIFGRWIISFLSHHQINYMPSLLWMLASYHIISITVGTLTLALLSINDTKLMRKIVILQAILTILLSIIFVKYYGILGCALGSLVSVSATILWYSPLRVFTLFYKS
ncbi:MAG: oligosaccharide flippase family protein [Legionellales bacterium]|nr:oligosaccharide flippase family protein [Legionellales bacterium]